MARTVTLQSIADKARYMADQRFSSFTSDEEILAIINDCYGELYEELVAAYENYFVTTTTFALSQGVPEYDLPDDFYKIIGVDLATSGTSYVTLKPFMEAERNVALTTSTSIPSGTIRLRYIPAPAIFTDLSDTIDGVAGWDRLLTLMVAIDMMDSEESDTGPLKQKYSRMLQRIREMAQNRDVGMPSRVADIYSVNVFNMYGALKYRLYGDTIIFVSTEFLGSDLVAPYF